ncbi:MAG: hypothetical protein GX329_04330 [Tissierellia bacterium]|nr:hypothetical protein [Tissierellia bacterium]
MRHLFYRYRYRKIIGIILGMAGLFIIMSVIPIVEFLLIIIGGILIGIGLVILK